MRYRIIAFNGGIHFHRKGFNVVQLHLVVAAAFSTSLVLPWNGHQLTLPGGQADGLPATAFQHRASPGGLPGHKATSHSRTVSRPSPSAREASPRYQATRTHARPPARPLQGKPLMQHQLTTKKQSAMHRKGRNPPLNGPRRGSGLVKLGK